MTTMTKKTPSDILSIDIETRSSIDLTSRGVYVYSEAPDFQVLLFGYAFGDDPVDVIELAAGQEMPSDLLGALTDPAVTKCAHNANFERTCLARWFGRPMDPSQWECTMVRCLEAGLPASLKMAGARLGLTTEQRKNTKGQSLIKIFCEPAAPSLLNPLSRWNQPEHFPGQWSDFVEYNRQDVVAERELRRRLPAIDPDEQALWELDQAINDAGVRIDQTFAANAERMADRVATDLAERAAFLTGLQNPNSAAQLKTWFSARLGREVKTLKKKDLPGIIAEAKAKGDDAAREVAEIRSQLGKTSVAKYRAMQDYVCDDGRIRGMMAFYGGHTGRWAGRGPQPQNLPRNHLEDLDAPRNSVLKNDLAALRLAGESVPDTLSQLIRTAFIPAKGCRFIVSDFSAIEARVIAWLADEEWRLEVFRRGGKIYEESAAKMFHVPVEKIVKGNPEYELRAKGKVAELALGYHGASGALINMGALDMGLTEDDLPGLVKKWRDSNPAIKRLWAAIEKKAKAAIRLPPGSDLRYSLPAHGARAALRFYHTKDNALRIELPSGRSLLYRNVCLGPSFKASLKGREQIRYSGSDPSASTKETHGGKLTENVVQAIARDCLAESMRLLTTLGYRIVFHVHDEVIIEAPKGFSSAAQVARIMSTPAAWAPGLPLNADAYECDYYKKD